MSVRATISDSKSDFHKEFPYVIPPIYRKLADELLVELHLLSHQENFKNNPIFATGLKEIFYTFTKGYKPVEHISELFDAICHCNGFSPSEINSMSKQIENKIDTITKDQLDDYISTMKIEIKDNDYYNRINAIGIYKLVKKLVNKEELEIKELDTEIVKISEKLGYPRSRIEKDISLFKSNIEKMEQALLIISQNLKRKK